MMETCWLVKCPKGDAVFLKDREQRALDYAAEHNGIIVKMYGQSHGKTLVDGRDIRPAGSIIVQSNEQLHSLSPDTGEVCETSKPT